MIALIIYDILADSQRFRIKDHELIIFLKKNIILHLFLRNLEIFITFAGNVQYNALLNRI